MNANVPITSLQLRYVIPSELALLASVSMKTVERWVAEQEITCFKVGYVRRFDPDDVAEFVWRNRIACRPAGPVARVQAPALTREQFELRLWERLWAIRNQEADKAVQEVAA